jgi:hypothetical protein
MKHKVGMAFVVKPGKELSRVAFLCFYHPFLCFYHPSLCYYHSSLCFYHPSLNPLPLCASTVPRVRLLAL